MSEVKKPDLLKRFVEPEAMPLGAAAHLDKERNILFINRPLYNALGKREQTQLWRCTGTIVMEAK
jgi:hypothetical protein